MAAESLVEVGFFSLFFLSFEDLRPSAPKLVKVNKTSRGGAAFHFEQVVGGKSRYFELLNESMATKHINLVCSNRPKCTARYHLPIIGEKIKIVTKDSKLKLQGLEADIRDVANYGQLFHCHSAKCKGKLIFTVQISFFFQR